MTAKRLAIVGAGCSGLVTLKLARERLPGWEIICFEKDGTTPPYPTGQTWKAPATLAPPVFLLYWMSSPANTRRPTATR